MNVHPKSASAPSPDRSGTSRQPAGHGEPARRDPPGPGRDRPDHDDGKQPPLPDRQSPPRKNDPPRTPDGGRERKAMRHAAAGLGAALALASFAFLPTAPAFAAADAQNADEADSAQPVTDTWITGKVKAELATTDGVHSLDIGVTTVNGVVTLTGVQPTELAVKKAIAAAKSVKGVKAVDAAGLKTK